jgi:uncharacterized protein YbaP (TraB family)
MARFLLIVLLLAALPARAFDCGGHDILAQMDPGDRAALEATAAAYPHHTGLLWRATRDDATITLFGTYHVHHPGTQAHFEALLPLARAADATYFEMNAPDTRAFEQAAATDASVLFITDGPTLPDMLGEPEWQKLRAQMADRGFPSFMTAKFKPVFVSMMLGLSPCQIRAQNSGGKGIDQMLAEALDAAGADTRSIEDYLTTMQVLDAFTAQQQIAMLRLSMDLPVDPDDMVETMYLAYDRGQAALLWELGRALSLEHGGPEAATDFARFEQVLLTDRNLAWIDTLDRAAPGHDLFVAVGAAHLPGDTGLLNLLAQRGFAISALPLD